MTEEDYDVAIISCDIVGHSSVRNRAVQIGRVADINSIVASTIASCEPASVVWASGGDGGHVIFRKPDWPYPALTLARGLRQWSRDQDVPLRVTCHYGRVADVGGADGRVQVVGDGINFAGWLLSRGTANGVVVSSSFRNAVEHVVGDLDVEFHDPRELRHKNLPEQVLCLASIGSDRSAWEMPVGADGESLTRALSFGAGWDVLYYSKRILQVNTEDSQAVGALHELASFHLQYKDPSTSNSVINPFLGHLEPHMLREVVQLGQLVERRYNDIICRYGDAGNTMFLILRGQVGVYKSEGEGSASPAKPAFVHQEGEIVGELAFALSRHRTADLVALTDVALLSFNFQEISARLSTIPSSELALHQVNRFISYRVLEHVSHNAPYLLGHERTGPLAAGKASWQGALTLLGGHCRLISLDARRLRLDLRDLNPDVVGGAKTGIYILAAGEIRVDSESSSRLQGEEFPVLWVDVPDLVVLPNRSFTIESEPIKVLHIRAEGVARLDPRKRRTLTDALRRSVEEQSRGGPEHDDVIRVRTMPNRGDEFDVFLCHSSLDAAKVREVADRMQAVGISCWLDAQQITFGDPIIQKIEHGLRKSRYLVPCVSASLANSNWARAEYGAILRAEISGRPGGSVIPLMLDDEDVELPLLLADKRRVRYTDSVEFASFLTFVSHAFRSR